MLPDVQCRRPEYPFGLSRVGVTGIKKLVEVRRPNNRPIVLVSTFDVFVDLPYYLKGVSMSRNFEAIDETIESLTAEPISNIEDLVVKIAEQLIKKHEYASRAEVLMSAEFINKKKTPVTNLNTQEVVKILSEAVVGENERKMFVGVEVTGITVCPCAQELVKARAKMKLFEMGYKEEEIEKILSSIPIASHNQRGRATIKIEVRDDFRVPIAKLIDIAKSSMSYESYEILKREDEVFVVEKAHSNPRFVEDCVRYMAAEIVRRLKKAPDDALVIIRQENEESIHQHNVVAERVATFGELRNEINESKI